MRRAYFSEFAVLAHFFCWLIAAIGVAMVGGTLLSLWDHPHWFVRGWDFPRAQILVVSVAVMVMYYYFCFAARWYDWTLLVALVGASLWQIGCIFPYTPLGRRTVLDADTQDPSRRIRLALSNVLLENTHCELWKQVITAADPDVILAVEPDQRWERELESLTERWPWVVRQPQDNCYGMMLYSRLEIDDVQLQYRVQEDVPSVSLRVRLPAGIWVRFYGVHPRPPEPIRDQSSTPRDAELVLIGKEVGQSTGPTIVGGDLNDVAWSKTTRLFQRLSKLLDPRRGRGLFNTWNANNLLMRFPLDHVFHSNHFRLVQLKRLDHVGSDHFPVLIELSYQPEISDEQPPPEKNKTDAAEAQERIDNQIDAEREGEEEGILAAKVPSK
jgi:endonuclease/exonuclease/phosphatase (EEP) superfamily protein YafD